MAHLRLTVLFSLFRTLRTELWSSVKLHSVKSHFHYSVTLLSEKSTLTLGECYSLLGLNEGDVSESEVRAAYFKLAKQYHPDSGQNTADSDKFGRIDHAYKVVLKHLNHKPLEETEDETEGDKFDIRHTAPQHRKYLEYGGLGSGTPEMRQKQYRHHRFEQAIEGVYSHKVKKHGAEETSIAKPEKKAIRKTMISGAIERMVEDLIQEAMSKGEFKNLPGSGKPIKSDPLKDPYMDSTTHRLNKILLDSGHVPDWIALEKEIREDYAALKETLRIMRAQLGPMPFTRENDEKWCNFREGLTQKVQLIDGKIDKLNLVVPILNRQKAHICLEKTFDRILEEYGYGPDSLEVDKKADVKSVNQNIWTDMFRKYVSPAISWILLHLDSMLLHIKTKYVNKNR